MFPLIDKARDEWIYQPNSFIPLAKHTAEDELFYVVTDHLGTPKELVTEDGKHTAWSGAMGVWGKARNDACFKNEKDTITTDCPIRFQG